MLRFQTLITELLLHKRMSSFSRELHCLLLRENHLVFKGKGPSNDSETIIYTCGCICVSIFISVYRHRYERERENTNGKTNEVSTVVNNKGVQAKAMHVLCIILFLQLLF